MADPKTVFIIPKDGNVPHPFDSRKRIDVKGEEVTFDGQVRRLIRRGQVALGKAEKPAKPESTEETKPDEEKPKPKGKGKGKKGHQPKEKSTES